MLFVFWHPLEARVFPEAFQCLNLLLLHFVRTTSTSFFQRWQFVHHFRLNFSFQIDDVIFGLWQKIPNIFFFRIFEARLLLTDESTLLIGVNEPIMSIAVENDRKSQNCHASSIKIAIFVVKLILCITLLRMWYSWKRSSTKLSGNLFFESSEQEARWV